MFKNLFKRTDATEEAFIGIIRVAREDASVRDTLLAILRLDDFQRKSALGSLVDQLRLQSAPVEFVEALAIFQNDEVSRKALQLLTEAHR